MIRPTYSQTETTLLSALNVSVARICCFIQVSLVKKWIPRNFFQDITKSDVDLRMSFYAKVVLSCGTNLFQGMVERMSFDLTAFVPPTIPFFSAKFQCCVARWHDHVPRVFFVVTDPTLYPPCTLYLKKKKTQSLRLCQGLPLRFLQLFFNTLRGSKLSLNCFCPAGRNHNLFDLLSFPGN